MPVFFLEGLTGAFFQPLASSYVLAVLVSLLVALTVTPAMSHDPAPQGAARATRVPDRRWLEGGYERLLERIIRKPLKSYIAVGAVVAAGAAVVPFLGQALLPDFKERDFLMHWLTQPSTSGPEETRVSVRACQELRTIPGVRNCGSHIGQALLSDEVVGIYFGENWISVDPAVDYDETLAKVNEVVDGLPRYLPGRADLSQGADPRGADGVEHRIVIRVKGDDLETIRETAEKVREGDRPGRRRRRGARRSPGQRPAGAGPGRPREAQQYGLKPGDVRRASGVLMASEEVGDLFFGGRAYDVNVWSTPETRSSLTSIAELPIDTPAGEQVQLGDVADVSIQPTPNVIERWDLTRTIDVEANVEGRDLGSVARDVEAAVGQHRLPAREPAPRSWASTRSARPRRSGCSSPGSSRASGSSSCCRPRSEAGAWRRCRS